MKTQLSRFKADLYNGSIQIGNTTTGPGAPLVYIGAPPDKAEVTVLIFYDLQCPYCALEFHNASSILAKYLQHYDNLSIILVGFIVHDEAKDYHAYIRCLAEQKAPVLAILYEYYSNVIAAQSWPSFDKLKTIASQYGDWSIGDDCLQRQLSQLVRIDVWSYDTLRVDATPTMIVQSKKLGTAYLSRGVTSPEKLDSLLASLLKGEEPELG